MGTTDFFIMIPPSEGKAIGGTPGTSWTPQSGVFAEAIGPFRADIAHRLAAVKGGDAKLLGVKGAHLERAQVANSTLLGSPTLPAWQRYTGVVWDHLDLAAMPTATRNACIKRIFVPSGLLGIVRADEAVPDYRLKMGARLAPFGLMSTWWRDDPTDAFAAQVKKTLVIDLLPQEHRAAFNWDSLTTTLRVDLVSKSGAVVGGHNAKAAKGLLAQHLLFAGGTDVRRIVASFDHAEYSAIVNDGDTK